MSNELLRTGEASDLQMATSPEKVAVVDRIVSDLSLPPRSRGWLEKMQLQKLRKFHEQAILVNEQRTREELFKMLCDLRVNTARDAFTQVGTEWSAILKGKTIETFTDLLKRVLARLDEISAEFNDNATKAIAEAKKWDNERVRTRATKRAEGNVDRFYDAIDTLENYFEDTLKRLKSEIANAQ